MVENVSEVTLDLVYENSDLRELVKDKAVIRIGDLCSVASVFRFGEKVNRVVFLETFSQRLCVVFMQDCDFTVIAN